MTPTPAKPFDFWPLLRTYPYTTHAFHKFCLGRRVHTSFDHSLLHWFYCHEKYCQYHDKQ
jgi:hypothetical protein